MIENDIEYLRKIINGGTMIFILRGKYDKYQVIINKNNDEKKTTHCVYANELLSKIYDIPIDKSVYKNLDLSSYNSVYHFCEILKADLGLNHIYFIEIL